MRNLVTVLNHVIVVPCVVVLIQIKVLAQLGMKISAVVRVRKTHVSWWHCHLESFCASGKFLRTSLKSTIKRHAQMHRFPDGLESFRIVWKLSG